MNNFVKSLAAAALLFSANHATAEEATIPAYKLEIYSAIAKLEANKSEAAGAVMMAASGGLTPEQLKEAREDFDSDLNQLSGYITALQDMPLTEGQAKAVTLFEQKWMTAAEQAAELFESESDDTLSTAIEWWESLEELDDLIDDQMEEILEEEILEAAEITLG